MPAKPGFEIAVKEDAHGGGAKEAAAPSEPIEKLLQTASVEKGDWPLPRSAPPAIRSKRVAPTASARTSTASSNEPKGQGRGGFNFSAAMKAKGGTWTYDDLNKFLTNPKAFVPGTAMGFAGISKDSERADVIAYLRSLSETRLRCRRRRSKISSVLHGLRWRPGIAWPFAYRGSRRCYRGVSPHGASSWAGIMRKKQRYLSNPCLILGPH